MSENFDVKIFLKNTSDFSILFLDFEQPDPHILNHHSLSSADYDDDDK